jgi:hypothetical protein
MKRLGGFGWLGVAALLACGGSKGDGTGSADGDETSASADDDGTSSASAEGTTSASASASMTNGADSSGDDVNDDFNDDGPVGFDLGGIPDTPPSECGGEDGGEGGGGGAGVELSYIWIANTGQDTISKIDTASMEEEGRYMAKASNGDPSRTSVNLNGDVAVANRNGGVAKFWANPDHCQDSNGTPGIQTSEGLNDVLPWDEEDCRAWDHPMVCSSNRPVAWTRGEWNEGACKYENEKLWTVCDSQVMLLNGETGETEQSIALAGGAFVYGGAADAFGNFWGLDTGHGQLFRVDHEDYTVLTFPLPASGSYGITVDKEGRPWVCQQNVARFNLDDSTWSISPQPSNGGGCMTDGEDIIWHATNFLGGGASNLVGFDIESLELVYTIPLPQYVHGISVDFQGKVWGVTFSGNNAYRADPESGDVEVFDQLIQAYTYSDMTGHALSTAGGGGIPQN